MTSFSDALTYFWITLVGIIWLYLMAIHLRAAWTGQYPYWRRKLNGSKWPAIRTESPFRFWLIWFVLAWPIIFIPILALSGTAPNFIQR